MPDHPDRTVRWAIEDLRVDHGNTSIATLRRKATEKNAKRIDLLFDRNLYDLPNRSRPECHRDKNHSYISMYGQAQVGNALHKLSRRASDQWDRAATFIPKCKTNHHAARGSTLTNFSRLVQILAMRTAEVLASVIGNAVPPLLMQERLSGPFCQPSLKLAEAPS